MFRNTSIIPVQNSITFKEAIWAQEPFKVKIASSALTEKREKVISSIFHF